MKKSRRSFIVKSAACAGFVLTAPFVSANVLSNNEDYSGIHIDDDMCTACGACLEFFPPDECPVEAWEIDSDGYPDINSNCVACGACYEVVDECPVEAFYID